MKTKEIKEEYLDGDVVTEVRHIEADGVSIDNYGTTEIYKKGELVDTIKEDRALPPEVRPPKIVDAPDQKSELILLDHKDGFWVFNEKQNRDKTYWVTHTDEGENILVDAVTGKKAGHGVPAPLNRGTAISGYAAGYDNPWKAYSANAASYYNRWGFSTSSVYAPSKSSVGSAVRNKDYKMWYALAHGDSNRFQLSSRTYVYASDIRSYMSGGQGSGGGDGGPGGRPAPGGRPPFQFSFLGQCGAFTSMSSSTIHSAFRRGATTKTCAIGYYNAHLSAGWRYSLSWQKKLFLTVNSGYSFYTAFKRANAAYPACRDMTRFVGDTTVGKYLIDYGDEYEDDDNGGSGDDQGGDSGGSGSGSSGGGPQGRGRGGSGGSGRGSSRGRGGSGSGPRGR